MLFTMDEKHACLRSSYTWTMQKNELQSGITLDSTSHHTNLIFPVIIFTEIVAAVERHLLISKTEERTRSLEDL